MIMYCAISVLLVTLILTGSLPVFSISWFKGHIFDLSVLVLVLVKGKDFVLWLVFCICLLDISTLIFTGKSGFSISWFYDNTCCFVFNYNNLNSIGFSCFF